MRPRVSAVDTPVNDPVTSSFTTAYACQAGHEAPGSQGGTLAPRLRREMSPRAGASGQSSLLHLGPERPAPWGITLAPARWTAGPGQKRLAPFRRCTFSTEADLSALTCSSGKSVLCPEE